MTRITRSNETRVDITGRIIKEYMGSLPEEGQVEVADTISTLDVGDTYQFGLLQCVVTAKEGMRYLFDAVVH